MDADAFFAAQLWLRPLPADVWPGPAKDTSGVANGAGGRYHGEVILAGAKCSFVLPGPVPTNAPPPPPGTTATTDKNRKRGSPGKRTDNHVGLLPPPPPEIPRERRALLLSVSLRPPPATADASASRARVDSPGRRREGMSPGGDEGARGGEPMEVDPVAGNSLGQGQGLGRGSRGGDDGHHRWRDGGGGGGGGGVGNGSSARTTPNPLQTRLASEFDLDLAIARGPKGRLEGVVAGAAAEAGGGGRGGGGERERGGGTDGRAADGHLPAEGGGGGGGGGVAGGSGDGSTGSSSAGSLLLRIDGNVYEAEHTLIRSISYPRCRGGSSSGSGSGSGGGGGGGGGSGGGGGLGGSLGGGGGGSLGGIGLGGVGIGGGGGGGGGRGEPLPGTPRKATPPVPMMMATAPTTTPARGGQNSRVDHGKRRSVEDPIPVPMLTALAVSGACSSPGGSPGAQAAHARAGGAPKGRRGAGGAYRPGKAAARVTGRPSLLEAITASENKRKLDAANGTGGAAGAAGKPAAASAGTGAAFDARIGRPRVGGAGRGGGGGGGGSGSSTGSDAAGKDGGGQRGRSGARDIRSVAGGGGSGARVNVDGSVGVEAAAAAAAARVATTAAASPAAAVARSPATSHEERSEGRGGGSVSGSEDGATDVPFCGLLFPGVLLKFWTPWQGEPVAGARTGAVARMHGVVGEMLKGLSSSTGAAPATHPAGGGGSPLELDGLTQSALAEGRNRGLRSRLNAWDEFVYGSHVLLLKDGEGQWTRIQRGPFDAPHRGSGGGGFSGCAPRGQGEP